jgi:hypothetical protein
MPRTLYWLLLWHCLLKLVLIWIVCISLYFVDVVVHIICVLQYRSEQLFSDSSFARFLRVYAYIVLLNDSCVTICMYIVLYKRRVCKQRLMQYVWALLLYNHFRETGWTNLPRKELRTYLQWCVWYKIQDHKHVICSCVTTVSSCIRPLCFTLIGKCGLIRFVTRAWYVIQVFC